MLSSSSIDTANRNGVGMSITDDFNTKKIRFKESDASPNYMMVVDPIPEPSLSWKDILVGK